MPSHTPAEKAKRAMEAKKRAMILKKKKKDNKGKK